MKTLWILYLSLYNFKCSWKIQPILSHISTKHWIIELPEKYHNHVERSVKHNIACRMAMHRKNSLYERVKKNRLDKCKWIWEQSQNRPWMEWDLTIVLIKDDRDNWLSLFPLLLNRFDSFRKKEFLFISILFTNNVVYKTTQSFIIYIILFIIFLEHLSYVLSRLIIKFYKRPFDTDRRLDWIVCAD